MTNIPAKNAVREKVKLVMKKLGKQTRELFSKNKNPYKKLSDESCEESHGPIATVRSDRFVAFCVGEERRSYFIPLSDVSCPSLRKLIVESNPDLFGSEVHDVLKLEEPIFLDCSLEFLDELMDEIYSQEGYIILG